MRTFSFRFVCAVVLGLPLLLAVPVHSQVQPFQGVEEGQPFEFDFESARFPEPLPFDVWFYAQFDRGQAMSASGKLALMAPLNCNFVDFSKAAEIVDLGSAQFENVKGVAKIRIPVPALRPNRSYCFQFSRTSPPSGERATKFAEEAAQAIDLELQKPIYAPTVNERGDRQSRLQDEDSYNKLRKKLITIVTAGLNQPEETFVAPKGSFFDEATPLAEIGTAYREEFDHILSLQDAKFEALADFCGGLKVDAHDRLVKFAQAAGEISRKLEQSRGKSTALDQVLDRAPDALKLPQRSENELLRISIGLDPAIGAESVDCRSLFSIEQIRRLAGRLIATREQLKAFLEILDDLRRSEVLTTAAGLQGQSTKIAMASAAATEARDKIERSRLKLDDAASRLNERSTAIHALADTLRLELIRIATIQGSTLATYEVRAGWYISLDAGLGAATEIEELFSYVGTNVYFRPVNKKSHLKPLSSYTNVDRQLAGPHFRRDEVLKRFAVTVGLPVDTIKTPVELKGVLQNRPLILGGGYRLSDHFRATLGALIFKEQDPNLLVSKERFSTVPFLSFSIDWNVRGLFSRLGGAFGEQPSGQAGQSGTP